MELNIKPIYKRVIAFAAIAITALYALPWTNSMVSGILDKPVLGIKIIAVPALLALASIYFIYQREI